MMRHLFKLIWNRKRSNALIVAEIFASFLVTFAVMAGGLTFFSNWRHPLGYEWRDVWNVRMDLDFESSERPEAPLRESVARMLTEVEALPEVLGAALANSPPYSGSTNENTREVNGRPTTFIVDDVSDQFAEVMGLDVVAGRWFAAEDNASRYLPVVVNETFATNVYGGAGAAIGRVIEDAEMPENTIRIVGVIAGYRKDGELTRPVNTMLRRLDPAATEGRTGRNVLVRVRPGTPAAFEQELVEHVQSVAPDIPVRVRALGQMRGRMMRAMLAPLAAGGIVAIFLISMVGLGLTGVLWQNVTRRTRELGLRRAMGATGDNVHVQVVLEVILLATIAAIAGVAVIVQLPILGAFSIVTPAAFTSGLILSLVTIYMLALLCSLYPSWLASRLQPADALRYE